MSRDLENSPRWNQHWLRRRIKRQAWAGGGDALLTHTPRAPLYTLQDACSLWLPGARWLQQGLNQC